MVKKVMKNLLGRGFSRSASSSILSKSADGSSSSTSLSSSISSRSSCSSQSDDLDATAPKEAYGYALMSEQLAEVETIITRWEIAEAGSGSGGSGSGFLKGGEARRFFHAVSDLTLFAKYLKTADGKDHADDLARTTRLTEAAVKILKREFFRALPKYNDARKRSSELWAEEEEEDGSSTETAMVDIRSIANCMINAGYADECVRIYKKVRKLVVEEGIYRLGFQRLSQGQIEKLDPATLDHWIKNWLAAAKVVVQTLFAGERRLCDFVFGSSEHVKESCFSEIVGEAAVHFLEFPELVAAMVTTKKKASKTPPSQKRTTQRLRSLLHLHGCIVDLQPEIETAFSHKTTSSVRAQAASSVHRLGVSVRQKFAEFENGIRSNAAKEPPIPGGGVHPLTHRVMDALALLSDHTLSLDHVFSDEPLPPHSSSRFDWVVLVLLTKLDEKARVYKDASLSYLFLANNLRYIVDRVNGSKSLREVLGEEWVEKHAEQAELFRRSYEKVGSTKNVVDGMG